MTLGIGLAFSLGVLCEWEPLNGIRSLTRWEWAWQDLGVFRTGLALLVPFLLIGGPLGSSLFLQPLLVAPVSVGLARFPWPWRLALLCVQWWILVCLKAKMSFLEP